MKIDVWIYVNQRTNPGRIHRILPVTPQYKPDGSELPQPEQAVVVAEILRESATDGHEEVQFKRLEATHLPPDFDGPGKFWGPNGEWMGPRGFVYIYEDEYPDMDPHELFRQLESIRQDGPPRGHSEVVQVVDPETGAVTNTTVPPPGEKTPPPVDTKPADSAHLPDGFPGKAELEAAGKKTYGKVRKLVADGKLQSIHGIGPETAAAIAHALAE